MNSRKRIKDLEKRLGGGDRRVILYCRHDGDRNPTKAEKEAAIEAYVQKHGDQEMIVLYWEGDHFREP